MQDPNNQERGFVLRFLDADKFELSKKHLHVNESTRLAGDTEGSVRGIAFQGNLYLEPSEYRQVVDAKIGWAPFGR